MAQSSEKATLPQWYHGLVALGKPIESWDFDDDLSDLEEPLDDDADSNFEDVDDDNLSERSYNGSDADEYYKLKIRREDRKQKVWELRQRDREQKARRIEEERQIGVEGQQTKERLQQALQQGQQPPEISLAGKSWNLYSAELPYVEFSRNSYPRPDDDIHGHVFLAEDTCQLPPFSPPTRASLEPMVLRGRYEIEFQFISNKYIIVKIPRQFVSLHHGPLPPSAPATFTFTGKREKEDYTLEEEQRVQSETFRTLLRATI